MEQRLVLRIEDAHHWGAIRHIHLFLNLILGIVEGCEGGSCCQLIKGGGSRDISTDGEDVGGSARC